MKYFTIIATTLMLVSGLAHAKGPAEIRKVARELGVSPLEMITCMKQSGLKRGQKLSGEQRAASKGLLLNCLQQKNADLTEEQLVSTMIRFRRK